MLEGRQIDRPNLSIDRRLRILVADPVPPEELEMWAAMSAEQRGVAMRRMKAIARWVADRPPHDAKVWADRAGIGLARFYEMSKSWRQDRSLAVVEAFAAAPRSRAGAYDDALIDVIGAVIDNAPDSKKNNVRYLAIELGKALDGRTGDRTPSYITLRRKVEDELRTRARRTRPGSHVQFDCCAISMSTLDQKQLTMFVVFDVATQLVIGASIGDAASSRHGYAHAASSALRRLNAGSLSELAWSDRLGQMELVAGFDEEALIGVPVELIRAGVVPTMQVAIATKKRFGKYLRKTVGPRIGHVLLLPSATLESSFGSNDDRPVVSNDDITRFEVEIEVHNLVRVKDLERAGDSPPPADLINTLLYLASSLDE